ncbi:hypothetical protein [Meiothermus sp. QL-1]|uniref:hypothetical protein n=1 Tax=Meiothermus sp. QL-1 TaxID=2058095 RepID=UPI001F456D12|nr:hypothetical protein [Meiothermus sp. QL-1]
MSLYQTLSKSLEPVLGERTRVVLEEGIRRLGITPDKLDAAQAEVILKRLVYRELQSKMSPNAARSYIEGMLKNLGVDQKKPEAKKLSAHAQEVLAELEAGLKRFSLYLEWPEVGRLRGLVNAIKQESDPQAARGLLREGQEVLAGLEEKLQAALLRQSRDIAELESSLERVRSVGGAKVRRLESYLRQIKEAHAQETLAPAEVQRARALAAEMRKLVESSVVQSANEAAITLETREDPPPPQQPTEPQVVLKDPTIEAPKSEASDDFDEGALVFDLDFEALTAEQQSRIREIDVAEDKRRLEELKERYAAVLELPQVAAELAQLEGELEEGNPLGDRLQTFEAQLKGALTEILSEARVRYEWLVERLRRLELPAERTAPVQARLAVVLETLQAGGLPGELPELERALGELEAEEKALREERERQARLAQALNTLRSEAEHSLSPFRGHPRVEAFLEALARPEISEAALQGLRQELSELLGQLAREREEEGLRRMGLRAQLQALPPLEALEAGRKALLARLERDALAELEQEVGRLVGQARQLVAERLTALEGRIQKLEQTLKESLIELKKPLEAAREALSQGRVPDPRPLEQALVELYNARRNAIAGELQRYEAVGQSMKGLGGEELLEKVGQARARLQAGELPDLSEIHALLGRLRRAQEALRTELQNRIGNVLEAYNTHKSVGGETALRLKPLCDFLQSAAERLPRLGVSGMLEVRRALEEAERLGAQLAQEYAAAQSLLKELKQTDLDSLLNVFETPNPTLPEALRPFQLRGVEALALLEEGRLLAGQLPFAAQSAQAVFNDLHNLAQELQGSPARLAVVSLPQWVLLLAPFRRKGLVILAEKALLSRLLALLERQREALETL